MTTIDLKKELLLKHSSRALAWLKRPLKITNVKHMFSNPSKELTTKEDIERYIGSAITVEEQADGTFEMYLQPKVQIMVYIKDFVSYMTESICNDVEKHPEKKEKYFKEIERKIMNDDTMEFCYNGASSIININDDDILMVELFYDDEDGRRCAEYFDMTDDDKEELISRLYK